MNLKKLNHLIIQFKNKKYLLVNQKDNFNFILIKLFQKNNIQL